MFVITGATGQLGSRIVRRLLTRVPADQVVACVRDPERAAGLLAEGVEVRRGDYTDPASLAEAFKGASQVLVVSVNDTGDAAVAQHRAAIDAARAAGAERILYTSHQGAGADSLFAPMPDHAATERYLSTTGAPFTSLRNGFYAGTVPLLLGGALETGELRAPADGPVSWTTHDDLAEAAAVLLTDEGRYEGPTPPLTAARAYDLDDVAGILTRLGGRTVRRVVVEDEEWTAGLVGHGMPAEQADLLLGMFHASRRGEFTTAGTTLEDLLGRPATALPTFLEGVVPGSR
ncbi:SDR family oxidoreductase [Streptomyces longwoodensis]|uniref:SDR family oxidoreductase n=1 Tax=Streptomyces longwoodensis TaxID=68231 RepID=UPI002E805FFA|nr:SDR family oxidoreductase [Streptomyces longwoodensis]WTI49107.1 SDR family oxidoreductase [Streptomyces longwoodensis]WUC61810.1 SDR family oxidoreductase [Streptomyces longwoodensis]